MNSLLMNRGESRPGIIWWTARIGAALLVLLVVTIGIGQGGPPNPLTQPMTVTVQLVLLGGMLAGSLLGMVRPVAGAVTVLACLAAFDAVNLATSGVLAGPWFHAFLIPALLYLVSARMQHARRSSGSDPRKLPAP